MDTLLLKQIVSVLTSLVVVLQGLVTQIQQPSIGNSEPRFGAVTQLTDTINTFRTNVNSTDEALRSTTSTDPGHVHTTGSVSGTIAVAKGGSGTSTYTYGFVVASSTNTFTTFAPTTSGQIPIASGTQWTANGLTAGNGITISTTTPGSISLSANGFILIDATSTNVTIGNSVATTTVFSIPIASSTLVGSNTVYVHAYFSIVHETSPATNVGYFTATYASSTFANLQIVSAAGGTSNQAFVDIVLQAKASSSSQYGTLSINSFDIGPSSTGTIAAANPTNSWAGTVSGTSSGSTTSTQNLVLLFKHGTQDANNTITLDSYVAWKILNQ